MKGEGGNGLGSDERDADGDAGRLVPGRRVLSHEVLHYCVFRHVLHQIGLLEGGGNVKKNPLSLHILIHSVIAVNSLHEFLCA